MSGRRWLLVLVFLSLASYSVWLKTRSFICGVLLEKSNTRISFEVNKHKILDAYGKYSTGVASEGELVVAIKTIFREKQCFVSASDAGARVSFKAFFKYGFYIRNKDEVILEWYEE